MKFYDLPVDVQAKLLSEKGINASAFKGWKPGMQVDGQEGAKENEILMDGVIVDTEEIGFYREYLGDDSAITDRLFRERLAEIEGTPRIFMNSPGGDVHTAFAIVQMIEEYDGEIECMAVRAASAASLIMAACDRVVASKNAEVMIHQAWGIAIGDADDMREYADYLDRQTMRAISVYDERMKKGEKEVMKLMKAETFMNAEEALDFGLVDEIYKPKKKDKDGAGDPGMLQKVNDHLAQQIAVLSAA